jgi:hypothetical protein
MINLTATIKLIVMINLTARISQLQFRDDMHHMNAEVDA